jgi:poly-gamma-glutamate capsule biosynthesis protein CapA/YwtB (metallophosphatase superfamily)
MQKFLVGILTLVFTFSFGQEIDSVAVDPLVPSDTLTLRDTVTIIGVGDMMMGSSHPKPVLPPNDGEYLMKEVEHILRDADVTMGNLEGVLLDEGGTAKTCRNPDVCYVFKSPTRYVNNLVNAGFDVMSLANNHAGDFGEAGRKSSMKTLEDAGIVHAGQLQQKFVTFEKNGTRFGFVAFAPNSNCVQLTDLQGARALVAHLDSISDIVIVSFHGGAEGPQHQHITRQTEMYYGEDRGNVYLFARAVIDAGADVVFGHGPHVTRAIDVYKNRFIAYSLGNFCTFGGMNVSGVNGLSPIIKVYTNRSGEFLKGEITATYQRARDRVLIDPDKRVIRIIRELTKKDFPELPVRIDENGLITYLAQQDGL